MNFNNIKTNLEKYNLLIKKGSHTRVPKEVENYL